MCNDGALWYTMHDDKLVTWRRSSRSAQRRSLTTDRVARRAQKTSCDHAKLDGQQCITSCTTNVTFSFFTISLLERYLAWHAPARP